VEGGGAHDDGASDAADPLGVADERQPALAGEVDDDGHARQRTGCAQQDVAAAERVGRDAHLGLPRSVGQADGQRERVGAVGAALPQRRTRRLDDVEEVGQRGMPGTDRGEVLGVACGDRAPQRVGRRPVGPRGGAPLAAPVADVLDPVGEQHHG
jgi:hypothetical protein